MMHGADRTIQLSDGRRLGYAEFGDPGGAPVIYFHGWPGPRVEGRLGDEAALVPGAIAGMGRQNRLAFQLVGHLAL